MVTNDLIVQYNVNANPLPLLIDYINSTQGRSAINALYLILSKLHSIFFLNSFSESGQAKR